MYKSVPLLSCCLLITDRSAIISPLCLLKLHGVAVKRNIQSTWSYRFGYDCACVSVRAEKVSNVTPQQRTLIDAKMLLRKKSKKTQKSLTEIRQKGKQIKKSEACVKGICPVGHMAGWLAVTGDTGCDTKPPWATAWPVLATQFENTAATCGPSGLINPTTYGVVSRERVLASGRCWISTRD